MTEHSALQDHALTLAETAGRVAMSYFRAPLGVEFKADDSPVTQADKAVESQVRAYLKEHFPDDGIFGEEHGIEGAGRLNMWVIDPIDGTRSFLSGHPLFGSLLAFLREDTPQLGVIGMPALGEVYLGMAGQGASLNGAPIAVSKQTRLDQAILYINEGEKIYRHHPSVFDRLMNAAQTRRFGYDCYPHALLAAGHVDAVVDYDLQPYDFLALSVVIEAAGGCMTDWQGHPLTRASDGAVIAAATPALHAELMEVLHD